MKTYDITLGHDAGSVTIRVRATCINSAIGIVCDAEKAPRSAVTTWRIIPTARQIAKTKSLLRSI